MKVSLRILAAVAASGLVLTALPGRGGIIASTTFDGRTLTTTLVEDDTATNLNWTTNGVADPGNLAAKQWGGAGQHLFDGNALTQNMFAPALNVGNAPDDDRRSWTTTLSLTVLPAWEVSVESVAFDYWAISGGQTQQGAGVFRRSDFIVTLFDPDEVEIETVSVWNVLNGNDSGEGTPVLLSFASPIDLGAPGTYTLKIRAGDIADLETGNHTAIDNLSITGSAIPEPGTVAVLGIGLVTLLLRRRLRAR